MISSLQKKLLRDLKRMWGQAIAIALVMSCGAATLIMASGAHRALTETRDVFYDNYRFGHAFVTLKKAPNSLKRQIDAIQGVETSEARIVKTILLDMPGMIEPANGLVISQPDARLPDVNRLLLRQGRLPEASQTGEVAINENFAIAHKLKPGDTLLATLNGAKRKLTITALVLSPEYIYTIPIGGLIPDDKRFAIIFMPHTVMEGLFDMQGAFNSLSLRHRKGADERQIIASLNSMLKPYGSSAAQSRKDQVSNAFLSSELDQLEGMARIVPPIFLLVSAFLVNMILARMVELEREQIGLLKAVGLSNLAIGWHYAQMVIAISLLGLAIGAVLGDQVGKGLANLYAEFFSFPFLIFRSSPDLVAIAAIVTIASALLGAGKGIWSAVRLSPAVAMQPAMPIIYRRLFGDQLDKIINKFAGKFIGKFVGLGRPFSRLNIMAVRNLLRHPVRSGLTIMGVTFSVAILVLGLSFAVIIDFFIDTFYFRAERQDAIIYFSDNQSIDAQLGVTALPGVMSGEAFRIIDVVLRKGSREKSISLTGMPSVSDLSRALDLQLEPIKLPDNGVVLPLRLAEFFRVRVGDKVEIELKQHNNRRVEITVVGYTKSYVGLRGFMSLTAMNRMLGDNLISGVNVLIDENQLDGLTQAVKDAPRLAVLTLQKTSLQSLREIMIKNINIQNTVYIFFATVITFGLIYNTARILLSERARELANLRVFGFTRGEIAGVLMFEIAVIVLLAQPLGWLLGYYLGELAIKSVETDLISFPFAVTPNVFALASLTVLLAALVSALLVRRRLNRLDLIHVLKTRE